MEPAKQLLVAISIWIVLFVTLTPNTLRDTRGFNWDDPWTLAFAVALGICIWGFREIIKKVRGPR